MSTEFPLTEFLKQHQTIITSAFIPQYFTETRAETIDYVYSKQRKKVADDFVCQLKEFVRHNTKKRCEIRYVPQEVLFWFMSAISFTLKYSDISKLVAGNVLSRLSHGLFCCLTEKDCNTHSKIGSIITVNRGHRMYAADVEYYKATMAKYKSAVYAALCQGVHTYGCGRPSSVSPVPSISRFRKAYEYKIFCSRVISSVDKRPVVSALHNLPHAFGCGSLEETMSKMTLEALLLLHKTVRSLISWTTHKCILLGPSGRNGYCTCHAKCSRANEIEEPNAHDVLYHAANVHPFCLTCGQTPNIQQRRQDRCRRSLATYAPYGTCSLDGTCSFVYVPMYLCKVLESGKYVYQHYVATGNLGELYKNETTHTNQESEQYINRKSTQGKKTHYRVGLLCYGGMRQCHNHSVLKNCNTDFTCINCQIDIFKDINTGTCLDGLSEMVSIMTSREKVDTDILSMNVRTILADPRKALCDGCLLHVCCPAHHHDHPGYMLIRHAIREHERPSPPSHK